MMIIQLIMIHILVIQNLLINSILKNVQHVSKSFLFNMFPTFLLFIYFSKAFVYTCEEIFHLYGLNSDSPGKSMDRFFFVIF